MKSFRSIILLSAASLLAGCASSASDIEPSYVSAVSYQSHSCGQLEEEARRVSSEASRKAGIQDNKATNDKIATGVAIVLFWPAAFFVSGGNGATAAELANLRGQKEAIEEAADKRNCNISFRS